MRLKIKNDVRPPVLVNEEGKMIHYIPCHVPGKGWTVSVVIGSKRTGRSIVRAEGFERIENYTLAQAQAAAENATRDAFRAIKEAT